VVRKVAFDVHALQIDDRVFFSSPGAWCTIPSDALYGGESLLRARDAVSFDGASGLLCCISNLLAWSAAFTLLLIYQWAGPESSGNA
jgi:hypothetical protein